MFVESPTVNRGTISAGLIGDSIHPINALDPYLHVYKTRLGLTRLVGKLGPIYPRIGYILLDLVTDPVLHMCLDTNYLV